MIVVGCLNFFYFINVFLLLRYQEDRLYEPKEAQT